MTVRPRLRAVIHTSPPDARPERSRLGLIGDRRRPVEERLADAIREVSRLRSSLALLRAEHDDVLRELAAWRRTRPGGRPPGWAGTGTSARSRDFRGER